MIFYFTTSRFLFSVIAVKIEQFLSDYKGQSLLADAVVKGHVVITDDHGKQTAIGYKGAGLVGGYYMDRVQSYEETFAQMV